MNLAHVHLLLNHIPVLGTLFGLVLLVAALLLKNITLQRLSLLIFVGAALFALPVYFTGEPAEEVVEHLPGVTESFIEPHEAAAKLALIAASVLGLISVAGLAMRSRQKLCAGLTITALAVSLLTAGLMARTASLGGEIRHTEIRAAAVTSAEITARETTGKAQRERDDD